MYENLEVTEALGGGVESLTGTRYKVRLIEGDKLGATAFYPADVIRRDGPKVFTKGTPMFLDHQTVEEKANRPFGSITNFVGELATDAYYENDGLYADIEVFEDAAPLIKSRMNKIGVSIRADIVGERGEINGKLVPIAREFTSARSVDFVMRAGAGGKIMSILESAIEDDETTRVEEGEEMTQELVDALNAFKGEVVGRFEAIEGKLAVEPKEVVDDAKVLEIAEALAGSTLDAEGRARVLDLHRANGKPLADLIAAEEAYVKEHKPADDDQHGVEEAARIEAEESAKTITVPVLGAWKK